MLERVTRPNLAAKTSHMQRRSARIGALFSERENVVWRDVERLGIREMQAEKRVGVTGFNAQDAGPAFASGQRRAAQTLAKLTRLGCDGATLFRRHHTARSQTASATATRAAPGTAGGGDRALRKRDVSHWASVRSMLSIQVIHDKLQPLNRLNVFIR
jgi:hypothetical protein